MVGMVGQGLLGAGPRVAAVAAGGAGDAAATLTWLSRAAENPIARHPAHLPPRLDFRAHADLFEHMLHAAPPGTELGFPVVLTAGGLDFPPELATHARYDAYLGGGRLIGTFHVHPADRPPFFDPADLASALRSDNAGFVELLLARGRLFVLVRANPYLYISAHHVNRNPLLLAEQHERLLHRGGTSDPSDPDYAERYRRASTYFLRRYQAALYEGSPEEVLRLTLKPEKSW